MNKFKKNSAAILVVIALALGHAGSIAAAVTPKFVIGDRVSAVVGGVYARATASTRGKVLQLHRMGELGTVVGGPKVANGYTWWIINFDTGTDGWARELSLNKYTATINNLTAPTAPTTQPNQLNPRGLTTNLPDTGGPSIYDAPWNLIIPAGIIAVLLFLYARHLARKRRKSKHR